MPVTRDVLIRAYELARAVLRNGQPIPLSTEETRLLAAVVKSCAETSGLLEVPVMDQNHQLVTTEVMCSFCAHPQSAHVGAGGRCVDNILPDGTPICGCRHFITYERPLQEHPLDRMQDHAPEEHDRFPYLRHVLPIAQADAAFILKTDPIYGGSWQKRGGTGAFMVLARKWDRLEERVKTMAYDIFMAIHKDTRREGVIDDLRDLRGYLLLVEAKCIADGLVAMRSTSKDDTVEGPHHAA